MGRLATWLMLDSCMREGLKWEIGAFYKHYSRAHAARGKWKGQRGLNVQVGCGAEPRDGWINIDVIVAPGVVTWDCRRGLPFEDQSVAAIFSEHMFEHLDRPISTAAFLRECRRVLQPDGVLRVIVPDAEMYIRGYCTNSWRTFAKNRPLCLEGETYRDHWLGDVYRTRMEVVNAVFRQRSEHKFAYDAETLMMDLRDAGFERVARQVYGVGRNPTAVLDNPDRASESLYVEASAT